MIFFLGVLSASFGDACVYHSRAWPFMALAPDGVYIHPPVPCVNRIEQRRGRAGQSGNPLGVSLLLPREMRVRAIDRYRDWDYNENGETSFPEVGIVQHVGALSRLGVPSLDGG